ncbi:SpoIIE family protein phosphatase [Streptomyces mirabilis]|uniref:SpoIIE family protein phosphatase n=1 Tax=Streptomyces mirabilis TaxID=68239 RepID=UPI0035DDE21D
MIPVSGARVALVVSDVPASGMQATVCIGLIGAAVRALAELDLAPEEVLARLDDIVSRFTAGQGNQWSPSFVERLVGATYLYAVYDPIARRCVMATWAWASPSSELPGDPAAVADIRSLVLQQLDQWDRGSLDFTTELIASELVTKARTKVADAGECQRAPSQPRKGAHMV